MNRDYRKRQLHKINDENQALLKRIQTRKSAVNFQGFEKDRKKNEKILMNISQYPNNDGIIKSNFSFGDY